MTTADEKERNESNTSAISSSSCWQARDTWWKCLDLYDNCEWKCHKQIEQLRQLCSPQMVRFFQERREKLTQGKSECKLMLPKSILNNYLTDFRNNANHNFSSHQTAFPFDDDDDD